MYVYSVAILFDRPGSHWKYRASDSHNPYPTVHVRVLRLAFASSSDVYFVFVFINLFQNNYSSRST
jgi:hypothetical protein